MNLQISTDSNNNNVSLLSNKVSSVKVMSQQFKENNLKKRSSSFIKSRAGNTTLEVQDNKTYEYKPNNSTMKVQNFLKLKNSLIFNCLSFLDQQDFSGIFLCSKEIKKRIIEAIEDKGRLIAFDFNKLFKTIFKLLKTNMVIEIKKKVEKKNKKSFTTYTILIYLVLKSGISLSVDEKMNKSISISYSSKFYSDKESYKNFFNFDLRSIKSPLVFWIMREYTSVNF